MASQPGTSHRGRFAVRPAARSLVAAFGSPVWQLLSTATIVLALAITALLAISMLVASVAIRDFQA